MAASTPAPGNATTGAPSTTSQARLQLPPPQIFEILPPLHELLSRIDHSTPGGGGGGGGSATDHLNPDEDTGGSYADQQPLDPKDLPAAVLEIKGRIRRALRELEKLPDMDRSVGEQEEEIRRLEARIEKQNAVLLGLGERAGGVVGGAG